MKKNFMFLCMLSALFLIMHSCTVSDNSVENPDPGLSELEESFMSIENAIFEEGDFPTATLNSTISGLSINNKALQGGMNIITVVTDKEYRRFFIGIKNVEGYLIYTPQSESVATRSTNTYTIPVIYSPELNTDVTMLISGEDENGDITEPYEAEISFVDSEIGELNINLTFSNAKDVDLHLYMPDGQHIYYGNRGGQVTTVDGETISFGLDKDSNAGCHIDNLNNENIYIPAELIQSGTYRVVVDMYKNCDYNIPTSWSIVTRYKGELIPVSVGNNPASGVYPIGAGHGDMTTAMEFTINDNSARAKSVSRIKENSFIPTPLNDMDEMKLEEYRFYMEQNK